MAIVGVVTNTGLSEAVRASSNKGWAIFPTRFGVSATKGELRPNRTSANAMWYEAAITDQTVVSENTIQFVCTLPPQVVATDQYINEIYLFGENSQDQTEFLLAVGQPTDTITYFKDGSITLRMHVTMANVQASQVFEFKYTGYRSIEDHNKDEVAHQELFGVLSNQIKSLGAAILTDGQLASGGAVYIDRATGTAKVDEAMFYVNGQLLPVAAGTAKVPLSGSVGVGVWSSPDGKGSATLKWGSRYANLGATYYEVHLIEDGYLKSVTAGTVITEPVNESLIRYDREANGSYIVTGLNVTEGGATEDTYTIRIAEGKAHVDGIEVILDRVREYTYAHDPDTETVVAERHRFTPDSKGQYGVAVDFPPLAVDKPVEVTYVKASTLGIERGQSMGTKDFIVEGLTAIKSVRYGTSVFEVNKDFRISGAMLDWSPAGSEPPTGSTYIVECEHMVQVAIPANELSTSGFTLKGAVKDADFTVRYDTRLPRKDSIILQRDGSVARLKGRSDRLNLISPVAPSGTLVLAELTHTWMPGIAPMVANTGVTAVRAEELTEMRKQIADLFELMAEERMARIASGDDLRAKRGIFVDTFTSDAQRDGGLRQSAWVDEASQELTLAFDVTTIDTKNFAATAAPGGFVTLPYTLKTVVEQLAVSGPMLVNPYAAFDPIPPSMKLTPAVDNWTVTDTLRSTISRVLSATSVTVRSLGLLSMVTGTSSSTTARTTTSTTKTKLPYLRELRVSFEAAGFVPGETITRLTFNNRNVLPSLGAHGANTVQQVLVSGDNRLLDSRPLFISAADSVRSWRRSSNGANANVTEAHAWAVQADRVGYTLNSTTFVALMSQDSFENFDLEVRVRGVDDDDYVGIVLASTTVGSKQYTLTALRIPRSTNSWLIVYNYGQSDSATVTAVSAPAVNQAGQWAAFPDGVTFRVVRRGNVIEAWTSKLGQRAVESTSRYAIDLNANTKLHPLRGPGAWGIGAHSQRSNFEIINAVNHGNAS